MAPNATKMNAEVLERWKRRRSGEVVLLLLFFSLCLFACLAFLFNFSFRGPLCGKGEDIEVSRIEVNEVTFPKTQ